MPAVATHAGARLFFGTGVVLVEPLAAVVVDCEAVVVHCLRRAEMPDNAVNPAPLPCTRQATRATGRELPGLRNI